MESGGVIAEASWDSLGLSSQAEESEMMEQLLGTFPSNGDESHHQELPWSVHASDAYYAHCNGSSNAYSSASSNSVGSLILDVPSEYGGFYLGDSNGLDLNMVQEQGASQFMDAILNPSYGNGDSSCEDLSMNLLDSIDDTSNKRKRQDQGKVADETRGRKCSRKADSKRAKKTMQHGGEDGAIAATTNGQSMSCCTSEIDSQESPVASNPQGKTQTGRQPTTDPQSLYARKRRERINEKLKVLQKLVPNGTKVDISTMLEEAVQYVKFLQLQIKVLSSDDMWMYAPIAYNGMNIGIDLNLS
ncbi:hypothetical protein ACQ4PT_031259 [Festuca glaucescens]